jgi:cytoskeletal protein RodZ
MNRQAALWALAALLGIALTAAIAWTTSQLTSQHIGLSSEPISAGTRLAPRVAGKSRRTQTVKKLTRSTTVHTTSTSTPIIRTAPAQTTPSAPPPTTQTQAAPEPSAPRDDSKDGQGGTERGGGSGGQGGGEGRTRDD